MREWFGRVFEGRRGPDSLSGALFGVGLVLSAVAWFTHSTVLGWLVYLPWLLAVLRMFSTRLEQRYEENRRFLSLWSTVKNAVAGFFNRLGDGTLFQKRPHLRVQENGEYRHFTCPGCAQKLRIPAGRGRVLVTCPKCGRQFEVTA